MIPSRAMNESPPPGAQAPVQLQVTNDRRADGTVLALAGELDIASAPILEKAVDELDPVDASPRLVLDLSEVTFMDSTGLRALLVARQQAGESGRDLVLRPGPRQVQRVFELSGTLDRFQFEA